MSTQDDLKQVREQKKQKVLSDGINPYPSKFDRTQIIKTILDNFDQYKNTNASLAGRVRSIREHGKIAFFTLEDESGEIQLFFKEDQTGESEFAKITQYDIGDIVGATGTIIKSKTGQISLLISQTILLSKALLPLPEKWDGLTDKETRLRKRYLDIITNPDVRETFRIRHGILREMRKFFDSKGYTEVEVPILQPLYGGANAKPFTTTFNALDDTTAYLKIASELYLKRLLVAGIGPVYDIAKNFRNEGIDQTHYPEFTMMELYIPYADYTEMMNVIEEMTKTIARNVLGTTIIKIHDKQIDLGSNWRRVSMYDLIQQVVGIQVTQLTNQELIAEAKKHNLTIAPDTRRGEIIHAIFDKIASKTLIDPTWVYDYPAEISPLSKRKFDNPEVAERFELYVGTKEIYDGWSEMNDPDLQRKAFEAETYRKLDEGEVTQPIDEDFIEALEYGMPPAAGIGIGIERLTMFFTNNWAIQEVILFPFKKPESTG